LGAILVAKSSSQMGCDVLHCTANTFPIRSAVPVVLTLHDVIFLEGNPLFKGGYTWYQRLGNYYRRVLVRHFIKTVKSLATVSQFEQNNINNKVKTQAETEVVYNGVGTHFANGFTNENYLREKYNLPENYFLFLGNTDPKKNTPNTLRAFAKLTEEYPEAHLVIGDLDAAYINQCLPGKAFAEARKKIVPVGYIQNDELPGLMKMAKAFLYPSLRESFGIPLLEGMASGVPVISSTLAHCLRLPVERPYWSTRTNINALADSHEKHHGRPAIENQFDCFG
jgi:glycosyltransferase involved in cell wall biosynthesis